MMKINLVAVGRLKDSFYRAAADEYLKRLSRFAAVRETECPEGVDRGKATEAEAEEGESCLQGRDGGRGRRDSADHWDQGLKAGDAGGVLGELLLREVEGQGVQALQLDK